MKKIVKKIIGTHTLKSIGKGSFILVLFYSCIDKNPTHFVKYDYTFFRNNQKRFEYSIIQNRIGDTIYKKIYDSIYSVEEIVYKKPSDCEFIIIRRDSLFLYDSTFIIKVKDNTCWDGEIINDRIDVNVCFKEYHFYKNIVCKVYYIDYGSSRHEDQYNELIYLDTANMLIMQRVEDKNGTLNAIEQVTKIEYINE